MLGLDDAQKQAIGLDFVLRRLDLATSYGKEKLREVAPFGPGNEAMANRCFDSIEKLMESRQLDNLRGIMAHFKNIRQILVKCESTPLNEIELFEMKRFLLTFETFMSAFDLTLNDIAFTPMTHILDVLDPHGKRIAPFSIEDGFSDCLAAIRREKQRLQDTAQRVEIVAAESAEEIRIMSELSAKLRPHVATIRKNIDCLGVLDFAMAKAMLTLHFGCVRPKINQGGVLLRDMTNPMVADALAQKGKAFTPVTLNLKAGVAIITGANMGGKSVSIKTAVLNVALCQLGFFVFAQEAEIPLFDGIFLISQDMQDALSGLSSFGGEIFGLNALTARLKTEFLFVSLDELARSTNPAEGAAIVRAVTVYLAQSGSVCLISTHYDSVASPNVKHYRVAGITDLNYMDYRLIEASFADPIPRDALKICKLLKLDGRLMDLIEEEYNNGTKDAD